jgi:zinc transporter ZupT
VGGSRIVAFSGAFYWIAAFAVVAAVVNGAGIVAIFRYREQAERSLPYFMCFAAGVLISTPLVLALPNAVGKNPDAGFFALGGFLFMFFSNKVLKYYTKEETLAFGVTAAEGIGIHSLVDGVVYTVTFSVSLLTGVLAGTGLVVHEFAEGVITYLVLLEGDVPERKAAASAFVIAALTTPVGAFAAYPVVSRLGPSHLGLVLGFVSGVLLYVSAAHLLPEAQKHEKVHSTVAFVAGVALALFIVFSRTA